MGGQSGCERRIEVFVKKKKLGGGVWGGGGRGQGGCERRIEGFVKIQKKKKFFFLGGGPGGGVGSGGGQVWGGSGWWGGGGVRVDVNAMLGVGGDVGYGGCEPRIEGIVQCTKRYCTILRKCGGGGGAIFEPKTLFVFKKRKREKKVKNKKKFDRAGI